MQQAAEWLGLEGRSARRTYQRWEAGERSVSLATAARIQRLTHGQVTMDDLANATHPLKIAS